MLPLHDDASFANRLIFYLYFKLSRLIPVLCPFAHVIDIERRRLDTAGFYHRPVSGINMILISFNKNQSSRL